ncbi:MAG: hypothetical protein HYW81_01875, partial [Parcubacteria group bacterium]|nr:hypothetical protein [Parcubacteria group bacterium]
MSLIDTVYASEGVTAGAPGGLLDSFGLDPRLFLLQLANFIIVAIILWFLILKPLTKKLSERQKVIEDSLEN